MSARSIWVFSKYGSSLPSAISVSRSFFPSNRTTGPRLAYAGLFIIASNAAASAVLRRARPSQSASMLSAAPTMSQNSQARFRKSSRGIANIFWMTSDAAAGPGLKSIHSVPPWVARADQEALMFFGMCSGAKWPAGL